MSTEHVAGSENDPAVSSWAESAHAHVVYDGQTGAIIHIHGSTTFGGAEGRPQEEDEERALELARRMGAKESDLRTLSVEPAEVDVPFPLRVDLDGPRLTPDRSTPS
jgi:hypothetical protein